MNLSEVQTVSPLFNLVPLVVLSPVLGLLLNLIFGRRMQEKTIGILASAASGGAFVVSVILAFALSQHHAAVSVFVADWITIGEMSLAWTFRVDTLSAVMMLTVSGCGYPDPYLCNRLYAC